MRLGYRVTQVACVTAVFALATSAAAQEQRAGVVTTLQGSVTVARASLTAPAPLKFRDDVFVRDRITTGENGAARILLGGRALVTVREHSSVTITEMPGVSTIDVSGGRVAVAVTRERMRPGDLVEVRTPNAVAGIRGTVIVAEVWDSRSVITVLKGVIDVTRLDAGRASGPATVLNALQQVTVVGAAAVPTPQVISADTAQRLGNDFRLAPPKAVPGATTAAVGQTELDRTVRDLGGVGTTSASASDTTSQSTDSGKSRDKKGSGTTTTASASGSAASGTASAAGSTSGGSTGGASGAPAAAPAAAPVAAAPTSAPVASTPVAAAPVTVASAPAAVPTILTASQAQSMINAFKDALKVGNGGGGKNKKD